jgi:hypothetical protein
MAKNNTTILTLTLLMIAALFSVAGAIVWFGLRSTPNSQIKPNNPNNTQVTTQAIAPEVPKYNSLTQVPLATERQVDYSRLRQYLQQKDWKAADQETYLRLLDAAGPKAQAIGFTPQDEMETFSCTDLRTVDSLWSVASEGQQGFTVQVNILKALGGNYRKLYDKLRWQELPPSNKWLFERDYNPQTKRMEFKQGLEPNYQNPPPGHLPTVEIGYNFDVAFSGALKRCGF